MQKKLAKSFSQSSTSARCYVIAKFLFLTIKFKKKFVFLPREHMNEESDKHISQRDSHIESTDSIRLISLMTHWMMQPEISKTVHDVDRTKMKYLNLFKDQFFLSEKRQIPRSVALTIST